MTTTTHRDEEATGRFVVCPECEGEGSHGPGFVWTQDEVEQEDPEEFAEMQAALRRGQFDVPCEFCHGQRVVTQDQLDEHRDWLDYQAEVEAERRMGC